MTLFDYAASAARRTIVDAFGAMGTLHTQSGAIERVGVVSSALADTEIAGGASLSAQYMLTLLSKDGAARRGDIWQTAEGQRYELLNEMPTLERDQIIFETMRL